MNTIWGYPLVLKLENGDEVEVPLLFPDSHPFPQRVEIDMDGLRKAWTRADDERRMREIAREEIAAARKGKR